VPAFLNLVATRYKEVTQGVDIYSDYLLTKKVGTSKICGRKAVVETGVTRAVLVVLTLWGFAGLAEAYDRVGLRAPQTPKGYRALYLGLLGLSMFAALPLSLSIFPQLRSMPIDRIEPHLTYDINNAGQAVTKVYYNRGI
jgi:hypothetical protein